VRCTPWPSPWQARASCGFGEELVVLARGRYPCQTQGRGAYPLALPHPPPNRTPSKPRGALPGRISCRSGAATVQTVGLARTPSRKVAAAATEEAAAAKQQQEQQRQQPREQQQQQRQLPREQQRPQQEQKQQQQQCRRLTALTPTKKKATGTPLARDHGLDPSDNTQSLSL